MDPWIVSWNMIHQAQAKGPVGFLESLYLVHLMQTNEVLPQRQQILSQYIMSTLLPAISSYYLPQMDMNQIFIITPIFLQNINSVFTVIGMLQRLFPQESEYLLHLESMKYQLHNAMKTAGFDPQSIQSVEKQLLVSETPTAETTAESNKQSKERIEASYTRLHEYAEQIRHPEKKVKSLFPSLDNVSVLNTNDQLEELGVTMLKKQGRDWSKLMSRIKGEYYEY